MDIGSAIRRAIEAVHTGSLKEEHFHGEPMSLDDKSVVEEIVQDFALYVISQWKPPFEGVLAFKGGTLLARAYLNYHRFSHDLDFTWIPPKDVFEELLASSRKSVRRYCNTLIESLARHFEEASERVGHIIDFRFERPYVKFGCNSRMVTLRLFAPRKPGEMIGVKVQIRFIDVVTRNLEIVTPESITSRVMKRVIGEYIPIPSIRAYSIHEVVSEKLRAIVMRVGIEKYGIMSVTKDIFDLFHVYMRYGIRPSSVLPDAVRKTAFIDELETRYSTHAVNLLDSSAMSAIIGFGLSREVVESKEFQEFYRDLVNTVNELIRAVPPRLKKRLGNKASERIEIDAA